MNRTKLKNYAPQARRDFIQAMTDRAAFFGLTAKKTEPVAEKGDVAVIGGRSFPIAVAKKRKALEDRIKRHGFEQTMEAMAYTWFNRLVAIRFMELHGYLEHGYRVLSQPDGKLTPEILEHAEHVELPGLKKEAIIDLKLAGNKEGELYRLLLTAQCNALHTAMPFLFEKIDDETELLLPDNLLNSDSLMRKLVGEIEEEDWKEVEIIGWLYQFYISEKKDEVIGKVVASEDIPAATQLFTPNWIVKYLVQNTLGRQWLATYPQSALRQQMQYYIEPAEQTPEVQEQLNAITPTSLNPEELTFLDPACGSGHILVEAYELFKAIYQERGYRAKDIPALILQKNLFGMEIDDRAAQLAAFALMMKARADDRRIFDGEAKPNIVAFEDSQGMNANEIAYALNAPINKDDIPNEYLFEEIQEEKDGLFSKKALAEKGHVSQGDIAALLELFENAKTFGSLIQIPPKLATKLPEIEKRLDDVLTNGDLTHASVHVLKPILQQARLLARNYDAVVANPPYMGIRSMNSTLKTLALAQYADSKSDLYSIFIERNLVFCKPKCHVAMVTMQGWMFLSSHEELRRKLLNDHTFISLLHLGPRAFSEISGEVVQACAFVINLQHLSNIKPVFFDLVAGDDLEKQHNLMARKGINCHAKQSEFSDITGSPIAYWAHSTFRKLFAESPKIEEFAKPRQGLATANNAAFLRYWWEVSHSKIGFGFSSRAEASESRFKWFPHNKGGGFRRWYGNLDWVVDWENDGEAIKNDKLEKMKIGLCLPSNSKPKNMPFYFRKGITWSDLTTDLFAARLVPDGFVFDVSGPTMFLPADDNSFWFLGYVNSNVFQSFLNISLQGLHYSNGVVSTMPVPSVDISVRERVALLAQEAYAKAKDDWDRYETSFEFGQLKLIGGICMLSEAVSRHFGQCKIDILSMKTTEEEINRLFISALELNSDVEPQVAIEKIRLERPDKMEIAQRIVSYSVGCLMGRYSLDKPGLIYAHSGNQGFDPSEYKTFRADDDGIIPLLGTDWGIRDDAANRFVEFIGVAWPKEHLEENLKFVADSLGSNTGEQPRDTIRRYLSTGFYKHHLSMYKKRPIYWLFSSGKQRAFQCLVYLHRYHEGTLARMRTEYVIPLQGQIAARIEQLEGDKTKATSTSHRKKLQKEQDDLKKQQTELLTFEEKLKHAADQKISLDLDDGVKVNYAKFGDLLAESKAITGGKEEE
jgi:type II restriction/modification system DNA methylase subunit YeeA